MPDLPWEFLVIGVPSSLQSKPERRQGWKKIVARAAREAWGHAPPLTCHVCFEMIFYYEGVRADVDNIIKYTQDALSGIVYVDDVQLLDTASHVRDVNGEYECRGMTRATAEGFVSDKPFVVVRVYEPTNLEKLL